jgi:hypothetical protein
LHVLLKKQPIVWQNKAPATTGFASKKTITQHKKWLKQPKVRLNSGQSQPLKVIFATIGNVTLQIVEFKGYLTYYGRSFLANIPKQGFGELYDLANGYRFTDFE